MVDTGFAFRSRTRTASSPTTPARTDGAHEAGPDHEPTTPRSPGLSGPIERLNGGGGLVSTLHDMVALIRSLLPGGKALLKPETIALMMTNQLPEGQWIRFAMMGEQPGKVHGLAGGLIQKPSPIDHPDAAGEFYWGGLRARSGGSRRSATWPA